MLVKSKPMKKLCEYEGRGLPENVKSDCWNDVDETEYACSVGNTITISIKFFYVHYFPGEEENYAPHEAPWPRERHHRQLRAHLQARGVQDQEDRGSGSV